MFTQLCHQFWQNWFCTNLFLGDAIVEDNDDGEMYDDVDEIKNQILGGQEDEQGKQEANGNNIVVDYIAINIKNLNQKC